MRRDINESRLVQTFLDLVAINSPSGHEGLLATRLEEILTGMGLTVARDGSAHETGSDCGNLLAYLPPSGAAENPLFFCAHLDTVADSGGVKTLIEDGWIRTDGRTILGADDKAGLAVALETVRHLQEHALPHGGINLIFTVGEETGLWGARYLDLSLVNARQGYVLDAGGPVGSVVVRTPALREFTARVRGRAAHAGVEPEKGVNAITVAASALSRLPWGRLDAETTANVGVVRGGEATNIVPDEVVVVGEVRARSRARLDQVVSAIVDSFEAAAVAAGGHAEVDVREGFPLLDADEGSPVGRWTVAAAQSVGVDHAFVSRGGGSDANVLNKRGLVCVNLGLGMVDDHAKTERIRIRDLVTATRFLLALVEASGADD